MSRRRRLDRSRESSSAVNQRSMKSSWLGVASASVPASTLRVRVRLRLIFRILSLFSVVDARRRRVSGITGSGLTLTVLPLRRPCR